MSAIALLRPDLRGFGGYRSARSEAARCMAAAQRMASSSTWATVSASGEVLVLPALQSLQHATRLSGVSLPPNATGVTWSMVSGWSVARQ